MEKELINIESVNFTDDYIKDIKAILHSAKSQSYKAVNSVMIQSYWLVGFRIVEQEQKGEKRAGYGEKVIENLSKALNAELGSGMSVAHLKNCRQFYLTFPLEKIRSTLCSELSWSHIRMIMRLDSEAERNYYINEAKQGSWSVRELERNIKTDMFHRVLQNQIESSASKTPAKAVETHIKDPYILEFLGIKPEISTSEKDIENAIISHMEKFLLEMGKGFSFVERQMHIKKCDDDNPTIGIIFCADKDESIVKYSVLNESEQIFASKYKTVLPTEEELQLELDRNRRFLQDRKRGK